MNSSINNKWYVSIENKAKGPYSDLQMREKIQSGEFKKNTFTYKEGEVDWLPLEKQDIWTPGFIPKHSLEGKNSKDWILLLESPIKQGDYEQQGPFTQSEVKEKVKIGEVHLRDFCWRPGMESWQSLVETHELGFPRKDKIIFKGNKNSQVESSAKFFKENKKDSVKEVTLDLSSQMPEFVSPEELEQKETEKNLVKVFQTKLLPPIVDKEGERREIVSYLVLVAVCFIGAFYIGSYNGASVLKGVQTVGGGITSFIQGVFPTTAKISYVFLRELPLTRGTILIKTDGNFGIDIRVKVKDERGKVIRTLDGKKTLTLKANENGEAFLIMSQFKVEAGETYLVTTKAGQLTANKAYFHSKK